MTLSSPPAGPDWATDTLPTGAPAPAPDGDHPIATTPADPYDSIGPGVEVPRVRTPLDGPALRAALIAGHHTATGDQPSPLRLRTAWAMLGQEHGGRDPRGRTIPGWAIWCFDMGNIDAKDWLGDEFALTADEVIGGVRRPYTKLLRAHDCAEAGAADYWELLLRRWPKAVSAMDRGDAPATAHELKAGRYYTGDEHEYAAGMGAWVAMYDREFGL